jgi:hypothetical protein
MQVVEDEDERLVFRLLLEECSDSEKEAKTCLLGLYDAIETAWASTLRAMICSGGM